MATVSLKNLGKTYPNGVSAVHGFDMDIADGEFVVLLGPSGCGKSTTLSMLAGLEDITQGEMLIDGKVVNDLTPKERDIAMVFQSYALLPNKNVYDNIGFGLTIRRVKKDEKDKLIRKAAAILGLTDLLKRKPRQLSGGQRQRVAIGRCIVREPKLFLFDEPLSNLDAKLRVQMRKELIKLHKMLETTIVYVTHDQVEAMTMGDRIVIMCKGDVRQIGTPDEVYNNPADLFVATFIGSPKMNIMEGVFESHSSAIALTCGTTIKLSDAQTKSLVDAGQGGKTMYVGIRPDKVAPLAPGATTDMPTIKGDVNLVEMLGSEKYIYFECDGLALIGKDDGEEAFEQETAEFTLDTSEMVLFDHESEKRIFI